MTFAPEVKVVVVISDQMREDAFWLASAQLMRKHVVKRLERPPTPFEEVVATSHELAPGRHARQRPNPVIVTNDRAACESGDIRRLHPGRAIGLQVVAPQRVENDEDRLQLRSFLR